MILKNALISLLLLVSPAFLLQKTIAKKKVADNSIETKNATTQIIGNQINNANGLYLVKQRLRMADSSLTLIRVLHIGDSHVKSGMFSQPFIQKLNEYYAQKYNGRLFFNLQLVC